MKGFADDESTIANRPIATYAYPVIGILPVASVDTSLVIKIIEPLWSTKTETASRLRGRIETVLNWAKARGYREGDNGPLVKLLSVFVTTFA